MRARAITFDFNGTLSDDEPILFEVFAGLFAERGRPLTAEDYFGILAGLSDTEIVRTWLGDRDDVEALVAERVERYRRAVHDGSSISEDVRRAVRRAADRVPVAVVSGAAEAEIAPVLRAAGIHGLFVTVVSSDSVHDGKPHPDGYLTALRRFAEAGHPVAPAETVAFEDTAAGVASAKAAGLHCIAVAGTLPRPRLAEADEIVERIDEALIRRLVG